ncbi:acetylcholinesterase-1-like [Tetranychus urticae]|nr:acetylcholinesterase-1-like [Tetranychus urticae]
MQTNHNITLFRCNAMAKMYKPLFYFSTLIILTLIDACESNPIVTTKFGQIKGFAGKHDDLEYETFLGIPFAEPPLGHLRFQLPQPFNSTWTTPYEAMDYGNGCSQTPSTENNFNTSEDCLYLNIWRPVLKGASNGTELLPVMYYLHGSGYTVGSGRFSHMLAATQKIIFVSSNYRLGALGFAYGSHTSMPGNLGIYDALTVLRWIRDNIRSFGGDPNRVTLAGQSAGSQIVSILATLPDKFDSQSLFSRLIMMSGASTSQLQADSASVALSKTRLLASKVNCLSQVDQFGSNELSDETISCLKKVDAKDLVKVQNSYDIKVLGASELMVSLPVYGTELIPDEPMINHARQIESVKGKPMLFGSEQDEASMSSSFDGIFTLNDAYKFTKERISFAIKNITNDQFDAIYALYFADADPSSPYDIRSRCVNLGSDMNFRCPSLILAELFSQKNPDIYFYLNSYVGKKLAENAGRLYGTKHNDDIEFASGNPILNHEAYTDKDRKFSKLFLDLFGNFTKGLKFDDWPSIAVDMNDYEYPPIIKKLTLPPTNMLYHGQQFCMKWAELLNYSFPPEISD